MSRRDSILYARCSVIKSDTVVHKVHNFGPIVTHTPIRSSFGATMSPHLSGNDDTVNRPFALHYNHII
jgi:hypothetical protein